MFFCGQRFYGVYCASGLRRTGPAAGAGGIPQLMCFLLAAAACSTLLASELAGRLACSRVVCVVYNNTWS